tara:strand:+ start:20257 stop:20967 length:711 start_codon:yes stop_codon:yes gene_type:complete
MALPIVNAPRYKTEIPSTGAKIEYRPYVVKEEKILMIALETKDNKQIMSAMKDVISACVHTDIDVDSLASFDIEWLFLKLRAKSVGEKVDVRLKCEDSDCKSLTDVSVNLDDIEIQSPDKDNTIRLTEEIGVVMRYPSVTILQKYSEEELSKAEGAFAMIADCIDTIYDEDNVYDCAKETKEDVNNFLDNLSADQFVKITKWFEDMPSIEKVIDYKCVKCERDNRIELRGIQSFFT